MTTTLAAVIGENLRGARMGRGWSQEDLAWRMREAGIRWTRSSVARVEGAQMAVTAEDLLVLVNVLGVPLTDLLDPRDHAVVEIGKGHWPAGAIKHLPAGDRLALEDAPELLREGIAATVDPRWVARAKEYGLSTDQMEAALWAVNETDRRAAENLGVEPEEVVLAAQKLFDGRSLSTKRDELIAERHRVGANEVGADKRGLRGWVTGQLVEQLRQQLQAAGHLPRAEE